MVPNKSILFQTVSNIILTYTLSPRITEKVILDSSKILGE